MQKILTTVIAVLIIYTIAKHKINLFSSQQVGSNETSSNNDSKTPVVNESKQDNPNFEGTTTEKFISKIVSNVLKTEQGQNVFTKIIKPVNPTVSDPNFAIKISEFNLLNEMFHIHTVIEGRGPSVDCGHTVEASYQITNLDGSSIDTQEKQVFRLGAGEVLPALENVIVGMRVGETRIAVAPSSYAYDANNFHKSSVSRGASVKINVELHDILTKNLFVQDARIFDDYFAYQIPYLCGDLVKCSMKIQKVDGTEIYKNESFATKLGDLHLPIAISQVLFGKIPSSNRTVILNGKYLQALNELYKIKIPKNEFVIMEFSHFVTQ